MTEFKVERDQPLNQFVAIALHDVLLFIDWQTFNRFAHRVGNAVDAFFDSFDFFSFALFFDVEKRFVEFLASSLFEIVVALLENYPSLCLGFSLGNQIGNKLIVANRRRWASRRGLDFFKASLLRFFCGL